MAWEGSDRRARLPADWETRCKPEALVRNPRRICHWCGLPGGEQLDHKLAGDDHSPENLDWIHGRESYLSGVSSRNCHGEKSGQEGATARWARRRTRSVEVHPGLR